MKKCYLVALVLMIQCIAIGWLIARYELVISNGTEVRFECRAYDPYDPLRGRYLRVDVTKIARKIPPSLTLKENYDNKFFVRIEPSTHGLWRVAEAAFAPSNEGLWIKPKSSTLGWALSDIEKMKDESWESFNKRRVKAGYGVYVKFPDRLFVNEKLAPEAEKILTRKSENAVAVYRVWKHQIILIDIEINGESVLKAARTAIK